MARAAPRDSGSGTVLRNTEWVVGMVIYCGQETKVQMNSRCDAGGLSMTAGSHVLLSLQGCKRQEL
jgi:hypothetical protein